MRLREQLREVAPQISAAVPLWMLAFVGLTIMLTITESMELPEGLTESWIIAFFGVSGVLAIVLSLGYRQPIPFTGHILAVILFGSLAAEVSFPEMVGASMVAGALILVLGATGVIGMVSSWIPESVVMGVIAGAVVEFVAPMFTMLSTEPLIIGSVLAAYIVSQLVWGTKISPIISSLVVGVVVAGVAGRFGGVPGLAMPDPVLIVPEFSVGAILAALPVLIVLILAANIPSVIYLREQGYDPPEKAINIASGGATIVGSFFGPLAMAVPTPVLPIIGGPDAGPLEHRYRAAVASSFSWILIALGAATAAPLAMFLPQALIVSIAGLALISVLMSALKDVVSGPLRLGPVVAFAVVLSDISLLGLGPFFWALVLGAGFSLLLESEGWAQLREVSDEATA